ncbi:MAG: TetR/AcrR family transcriptional regulator [Pseudomonadota bacterium]
MSGNTRTKTADRRVARTQGALREALIALILERGWDETSVQDVCDRANVGRSTFYTYFASKEKLLISGFAELRKALRALERSPTEPGAPLFGFIRGLIEHVGEHQRLFRAVIGKRSGIVIQRRFRQFLIDLVKEDLVAGGIPAARRDAAAHYIAGALFELLTWWVDSRSALAPHDLEAVFRDLTTPALGALQGAG